MQRAHPPQPAGPRAGLCVLVPSREGGFSGAGALYSAAHSAQPLVPGAHLGRPAVLARRRAAGWRGRERVGLWCNWKFSLGEVLPRVTLRPESSELSILSL